MARYEVTAPDGTRYEVTAPDDMSQADVLTRFRREVGAGASSAPTQAPPPPTEGQGPSKIDLLLEAERRGILPEEMKPLLAEARKRGLVPGLLPETEEGRRRAEIDTEARRRQVSTLPGEAVDTTTATVGEMASLGALPQIVAAGRTALDFLEQPFTGRSVDIPEHYGRERDIFRRQIDLKREEMGWGTLPFDIAGGAAAVPVAGAGAAAAAATSYGRQLLDTARAGAAYGGVYGFNVETGDWIDKIKSSIEHAIGGAVAAPALRGGFDVLGAATRPIRDAFRRWRADRAARAAEFDEAGVPLYPPALGGATMQGAAGGLSGTLFGSSLRHGAGESITALEARLNEELAGAGGLHTPAEAGEAAQGFLRRSVLERSRPKEEVEAMGPEQLYRLSGVGPNPEPDTYPRMGRSRESYPTEADAGYAALRQMQPSVQENLLGRRGRPAQPPRVPRPKIDWRYTPEEIEGAVSAWEYTRVPPERPQGLVEFIRRLGGIRDDGSDVRHIMGGANQRPGLINNRTGRNLDDVAEAAQQAGFFHERPTISELLDKIDDDLRGLPVVRLADEDALIAIREHQSMLGDLGRLGVADAQSADDVRAILSAEKVRTPQSPIPGRPGASPVQTHTTRLLDDIAIEARGMGQLPGYRKGQLFGEDHRLRPDVLAYLRPRVGEEIANMLAYYSEQRATGRFVPGVQGLQDIRSMVGRAVEDAVRSGLDRPMLQRLYQALDRDIERFVSISPEGAVYRRQRQLFDASYARFLANVREPLRRILGENVDPVAAIGQLVRATRQGGNIDVLRAFYRVAREKGDRVLATSWLLHNMTEGGLRGFLAAYRSLSPDARRLMFQGNARELGERLDLLARVGGRLERFAATAGDNYAVDITRWLRPGNLGFGLLYYISTPAMIASAVGAELGSRILASRWFGQWLARAPVHRAPTSPEWAGHVNRLIAIATESLGLNEPTAEALRSALTPTPAGAEEPPGGGGVAGKPGTVAGKPGEGRLATGMRTLGGMVGSAARGHFREAGRAGAEYLENAYRNTVEDVTHAATHPEDVIGPGNLTGTVIGRVGAANLAAAGRPVAQKVLRMARELWRRGRSLDDIRERTDSVIERDDPLLGGIVQLPNGQWGIELSNMFARYREPPPPLPTRHGRLVPYPDVVRDPELATAYPQLRNVFVGAVSGQDSGTIPRGYIGNPSTFVMLGRGTRDPFGTVLHEGEHVGQMIEDFPYGGTPEAFFPGGPYAHLLRQGEDPVDGYLRIAGEWLARKAAERRQMTGGMRRRDPLVLPNDAIMVSAPPY
jgi:hypothetical protein